MGTNDETIGKISESVASAHKRIDSVEREVKDLRTLTLAVAKVDGKVDNLKADIDEVKVEIKQVVSRPGQWWDKLIAAAIGACASGIVAAILSQILK